FTLNITPTVVARYRKNNSVRTKAIEVPNQVDSTISFVCYQFSDFVRAVSVAGAVEYLTQDAGVESTFNIAKIKPGLYFVPAYDISNVAFPETWVANTHYKVVDAALGGIEVIALPEGVAAESAVAVTYDNAAISA